MNKELSEIDRYIIEQVKLKRLNCNYSQEKLSLCLGKNVGFIGDIEAPSKKAKYNIQHLNEISKVLKCSPKDFWPEKPL